ncbi:MAG: LysR family transcriptional regulator [Burkholderiales bacterium]|nr:LysR family transcriptional regulator [Burkholderiales bacterium]
MTLTELRYIVAVARERHFGRAAEACFVSQPTLSVAVKKLEDELGVPLFERSQSEVSVTAVGAEVVAQAQRVLEAAGAIKEMVKQRRDPLAGPLRVGVIYSIAPYLLPSLVPRAIRSAPHMPLVIEENFTVRLLEMLKSGDIDVAILAQPFAESGLMMQPLYDEPFLVALPAGHPWTARKSIPAADLKKETMLLLGSGHCLRDQVLQVCPELMRFSASSAEGIQKTFEGSSLETIRHMVASGVGLTVMPASAIPPRQPKRPLIAYRPFSAPAPGRRVALAWRRSFPRGAAIEWLRKAVQATGLAGVTMVDAPAEALH